MSQSRPRTFTVLCDLKTLLESSASHHITRDKTLLIADHIEAP